MIDRQFSGSGVSRPPDYQEHLRKWAGNLQLYAAQMLKIRTKDKGIQPLRFNTAQKFILGEILKGLERTGRRWFVILKARQLGLSTFLCAYLYHLCAFLEGQSVMLVGGDDGQMKRLLNIMHMFYKRSVPRFRPTLDAWNNQELHFENMDSHIFVQSARNYDAGRSATLQGALATELSIWPKPEETLLALAQAITDRGAFFLEFTGKGVNHYSYDFWQATKRGENDYVPVFMPWFMDPDYRHDLTAESAAEIMDSLTDEEQYYRDKFNLDAGQLSWRRYAVRTKCQNDPDLFRQEYPAVDEEAFIVYGKSIFNRSFLKEQGEHATDGVRGEIRKDGTFRQTSMGNLVIHEPPDRSQEYFAGWDISMGNDDSDPEAGEIVDRRLHQCAEWHGKKDPVKIAEDVIGLGRYYHNATVAVEINKMGIMTQHEVMKEYSYLYKHHYINKMAGAESNTYGWSTNVSTKPALIAYATHLTSEAIPVIHSARLLEEMKTYIQRGEFQWAAAGGRTDDCVSAWMIACFVAKVMLGGRIETGVSVTPAPYALKAARRFMSGGKEIFMPEKSEYDFSKEGRFPWMSD